MAFDSLEYRLAALFLLIGLVPLLVSSYTAIREAETGFLEFSKGRLQIVLERSVGSLIEWIQVVYTKTDQVVIGGDLARAVQEYGQNPSTEGKAALLELLEKKRVAATASLGPTLPGYKALDVLVTDSTGVVTASTNILQEGRDFSQKGSVFAPDQNARKTYTDLNTYFPEYSFMPIVFSMPLTMESGELVGVAMVVYSFKDLQDAMYGETTRALLKVSPSFEQLASGSSPAENIQVYAVGKNRKISIPSYQMGPERSNFEVTVDTLPVRECVDSNRSYSGVFENHLGEQVLGLSLCGANQAPYIVEMPISVVLKSTEGARSTVLVQAAVFAFLTLATGLFFARMITSPIRQLTGIIEQISLGNLDVEVPERLKESSGELGALARAFDRTLVSLKLMARGKGLDLGGRDKKKP